MTTTKIMAVGDLHLDWNPKFLADGEHDKIISKTLDDVTQMALDNGARMVVFTGDIFDAARPTPRAITVLIAWMLRHKRNAPDVIVLFYLGNHDKESAERNSLEWMAPLCEQGIDVTNAAVYYRPGKTDLLGIPIIIIPWQEHSDTPNPEIEKLLAGPPSIVFAHNEVKGAQMDNGWLADGLDLTDTKHTWVIGHLHTPQVLHGGKVNYVGTPTGRHWNHEPLGVFMLTIKHNGSKLRKIKREWLALSQPYKLVEGKLPKKLMPDTYYRAHVNVGDPAPEHAQVVSIKRIGESKPVKASKLERQIQGAGLPPPKDWLLNTIDPALREGAKRLLNGVKTDAMDDDEGT